MGHDEKEVTNAALETTLVGVCRHRVGRRRYFPLGANANQDQKVPRSFHVALACSPPASVGFVPEISDFFHRSIT